MAIYNEARDDRLKRTVHPYGSWSGTGYPVPGPAETFTDAITEAKADGLKVRGAEPVTLNS